MRKLLLPLLLLLFCLKAYPQDFLGISTGNYAGVTGVLLQPASIVDSRHKFDINIFSTGARYSNNYFLLDRNVILKFNKNNFDDYATFKANYLSQASLPAGESVFFNITNRTQLPLSFMATLSKKSAIALNFQSRSMIQGRDITQDLAGMAYNGFFDPRLNNTAVNASGVSINALNWIEAGLTYGRVLYDNDRHFLKAAFTAKYLGGVASLNANANNLTLRVNADSSLGFTTSNFGYNHSKNADVDMVFDKNYRPDASAFGFDAGLVYEYRGNFDNFRYIRNDDEKSYVADRRDVNKYIFKLGVSLLDAGMFNFEKPANVNSFSGNVTAWDIRNANYGSLREFDTALANRVVPLPNDPRNYNVYLPAALSVQADIRFVKGLFLNVMAYRPLKMGSDAGKRFDNYGYYTITPRYERRHFGIYLPYTFSDKNDITNYRENRLGATIRIGPLFIGSSNLGTMAFNKNLSAADVHVGLKIGLTHGKPTRASRLFAGLNSDDPATPVFLPGASIKRVADTVISITPAKPSTLLVDYSKGHVYSNEGRKEGNIIIINNNYFYGANKSMTSDTTIVVEQRTRVLRVDTSYTTAEDTSKVLLLNANNNSRLIMDTLQARKLELDSLINSLRLLRTEMDTLKLENPPAALNDINRKTPADTSLTVINKEAMPQSVNDSALDGSIDTNRYAGVSANVGRSDSVALAGKKKVEPVTAVSGVAAVAPVKPMANTPVQQPVGAQPPAVQYYQSPPVVVSPQSSYPVYQENASGRDMRRYYREAGRLRSEINDLENRLRDSRAANTSAAGVYPAYGSYNSRPTPPSAVLTPQPADTVYIRDTIRLKDTINTVSIDTLIRNITTTPPVVNVPPKKEKIVKNAIDYTNMPADILLFDLGKFAIRSMYYNKLNYLATILVQQPSLQASITGHTDKTGSPAVNERLSLQRANAVKYYLTGRGVAQNQVMVKALSYVDPMVTGNSTAANSQNRRVVVKIAKGG